MHSESRIVKFDFFQTITPDHKRKSFKPMLDAVAALPEGDQRAHITRDAATRLHTFEKVATDDGEVFIGELIRIRMNEFPLLAKTTGETGLLEFDADEGLGLETTFLYDPASDVIILQRSRFGVSSSLCGQYFDAKLKPDKSTFLDPILKKDALKQLVRHHNITKLQVRIARPQTAAILEGENVSLTSIGGLMQELGGQQILVDVSMGRKEGSLLAKPVIDLVKRCLGHRSLIRKLEATTDASGDSPDHGKEVLDLLEMQLTGSVQIPLDENRRLHYQDRKKAVKSVWANHGSEARKLCGS